MFYNCHICRPPPIIMSLTFCALNFRKHVVEYTSIMVRSHVGAAVYHPYIVSDRKDGNSKLYDVTFSLRNVITSVNSCSRHTHKFNCQHFKRF